MVRGFQNTSPPLSCNTPRRIRPMENDELGETNNVLCVKG